MNELNVMTRIHLDVSSSHWHRTSKRFPIGRMCRKLIAARFRRLRQSVGHRKARQIYRSDYYW